MFKPGFIGRARPTPAYKSNTLVAQNDSGDGSALTVDMTTAFNSLASNLRPVSGDLVIAHVRATTDFSSLTRVTPSGWVLLWDVDGALAGHEVYGKRWDGTEGSTAFVTSNGAGTITRQDINFIILEGGSRTPAGYDGTRTITNNDPAAQTLVASGRTGPALAYAYITSSSGVSTGNLSGSTTDYVFETVGGQSAVLDEYVFGGKVMQEGALSDFTADMGDNGVANQVGVLWVEF